MRATTFTIAHPASDPAVHRASDGGVHSGTARVSRAAYCLGMHCDYCRQPAVTRVPATAGEVCLAHAILFWTGFLAYAKDHRPPSAKPASLFKTAQ
jgi:hypothetical protein